MLMLIGFIYVYQFALRWRTESEVLSGQGESTCGNTRCSLYQRQRHHQPLPTSLSSRNRDQDHDQIEDKDKDKDEKGFGLKTVELPFAYVERGESKLALVKVVLCGKCCRKLMWKRNKEKEERERQRGGMEGGGVEEADGQGEKERERDKGVRVKEEVRTL